LYEFPDKSVIYDVATFNVTQYITQILHHYFEGKRLEFVDTAV